MKNKVFSVIMQTAGIASGHACFRMHDIWRLIQRSLNIVKCTIKRNGDHPLFVGEFAKQLLR